MEMAVNGVTGTTEAVTAFFSGPDNLFDAPVIAFPHEAD